MELPVELMNLSEVLAEHIHNTWMQGRLDEGWKYGDKRNDDLKTHPCLVPYSQLPEHEKDYDRRTSMQTIQKILSWGYSIKKL